jgi:spore coat protein H
MTRTSIIALSLLGLFACAGDPGTGDDDDAPPAMPWDDPGTAEEFLGFEELPEVELLIDDEDVVKLRANPREYVPARIRFQGGEYGPVGVRLKGQNSFLPFDEKPSFKINVNEYIPGQTFWGLKDLTFNNMRSDASMMHERLAYFVAREAGLAAPRCNHMLLKVNGETYGLYANVETIKKRMVAEHFENNDGPLFEATDVDFSAAYIDKYELESGPDDRSRLAGLSAALAMQPPEAALAAASAYIDLAHFQRYWAMSTIIGQFDAFPYSLPGDDYFVYDDPETGKLWLMPWGMDETFLSATFPPMQTNSVLAAVCKAVPSCMQGYVDQTWELLAMTEQLGLEAMRVRIRDEIMPYIAADPRKPYPMEMVTEMQTQHGYFIRGRREILTMSFPPPSQ